MTSNRNRLLAAWYVNGTLNDAERNEVEQALVADPEMRALVEQAERHRMLTESEPAERQLDRVSSLLLVQYADDPSALADHDRQFVESQLDSDPIAREALARLNECAGADAEPQTGSAFVPRTIQVGEGWWARTWQSLSASLLSPAPALAYLLLLVSALPLVLLSRPTSVPALVSAPVIVEGERALRGAGGSAPSLQLSPNSDGGPAALMLATWLTAEDLDDIGSFEVVLSSASEVVWSETRTAAHFLDIQGRASLLILLRVDRLDPAREYRIEIQARKPGSPLDGQALFARRLEVSRES